MYSTRYQLVLESQSIGRLLYMKKCSVVVISHQPTAASSSCGHDSDSRVASAGDRYMLGSIFLNLLCLLCGSWWALACTIPAMFLAAGVSQLAKHTVMCLCKAVTIIQYLQSFQEGSCQFIVPPFSGLLPLASILVIINHKILSQDVLQCVLCSGPDMVHPDLMNFITVQLQFLLRLYL